MNLGTSLKKIRKIKKLSQQNIANHLNVSQKTYSNLENNKSYFSMSQLVTVSEVLDFNLFSFLESEGLVINENTKDLYNEHPEELILRHEAQLVRQREVAQLLKYKISLLEIEIEIGSKKQRRSAS